MNRFLTLFFIITLNIFLKGIIDPRVTNPEDIFTAVYYNNGFGGKESISGPGSGLYQTAFLRTILPTLFKKYKIKTLLDAPCGDFHWMKEMDLSMLESYCGIDIVGPLIEKNNKLYATNNIFFYKKNIIDEKLPDADLMLCRDCLVHLKFSDIKRVIHNVKQSSISYILVTTFPFTNKNKELLKPIGWRPLDLMKPPFNFPKPIELINEQYGPIYKDKSLGLWRVSDLPDFKQS